MKKVFTVVAIGVFVLTFGVAFADGAKGAIYKSEKTWGSLFGNSETAGMLERGFVQYAPETSPVVKGAAAGGIREHAIDKSDKTWKSLFGNPETSGMLERGFVKVE